LVYHLYLNVDTPSGYLLVRATFGGFISGGAVFTLAYDEVVWEIQELIVSFDHVSGRIFESVRMLLISLVYGLLWLVPLGRT
jgi:hypothetical protein